MSKKRSLHFRFAESKDVDLYFKWANDVKVRKNSYHQNPLNYDNHVNWFQSKLASIDCRLYVFLNAKNIPVAQVRIDKAGEEVVIGISVDESFRGLKMGVEMLQQACGDYFKRKSGKSIIAYIKMNNKPSCHIFKKAGFSGEEIVVINGVKSYKLSKNKSPQIHRLKNN